MNRSLCFIVLIAAACVWTAATGGCASSMNDETIERILASDVQTRLGGKRASGTVLVDVRHREEYQAGHLPGAVNLGLKDAAAGKAAALRTYSTVIIYGQNPASAPAMALAKKLTGQGYPDVQLFAGGFDEWRRSGLPIERGGRSSLSRRSKQR